MFVVVRFLNKAIILMSKPVYVYVNMSYQQCAFCGHYSIKKEFILFNSGLWPNFVIKSFIHYLKRKSLNCIVNIQTCDKNKFVGLQNFILYFRYYVLLSEILYFQKNKRILVDIMDSSLHMII